MTKNTRITVSAKLTVTDRFGQPLRKAKILGQLISGKKTKQVNGTTDQAGVLKLETPFEVETDSFKLRVEVEGFEGGPWEEVKTLPKVAMVKITELGYTELDYKD